MQAIVAQLADGQWHSGEALAQQLGLSRAAIWKRIKSLTQEYQLSIQASPSKGYQLEQPLELLDAELILQSLSATTRDKIKQLVIHQSIDSTNQWLMNQAASDAVSGTLCLAEQQTAGRGRHGRTWISPYGNNLYLSILWCYSLAPHQLGGLSLAAGVALLRALQQFGLQGIGLKWPNDLVWQQRKLAGLLLEVAGEANGPSRLVLGIGLNIGLTANQGAIIDQPWVALSELAPGSVPERNRLAAAIIHQLVNILDAYPQQGLTPLLAEWRQADQLLGCPVVLQQGQQQVHGIYQGIDQIGALLLQQEHQLRAYAAGEIRLLRPDKQK